MAIRRKHFAVAAVAAAALITGIACSSGSGNGDTGSSSEERTIRYELTGTGNASTVAYSSDGSGSQSQEASAKLPWSKEIKLPRGKIGVPVITAQRGSGNGDITCRILVDGKEVKKATSSGQYAVVTCSGDVQF
jgi:hypothetical protein